MACEHGGVAANERYLPRGDWRLAGVTYVVVLRHPISRLISNWLHDSANDADLPPATNFSEYTRRFARCGYMPRASCHMPPASCHMPLASSLVTHASCLLLPHASCLLPPTSCHMPPPASCHMPPASCLVPPHHASYGDVGRS